MKGLLSETIHQVWQLSLMAQGAWQEWAEDTELEDAESPLSLERVGNELRRVRDDVLVLKGAVEIIEARYFGMSVLFPKDRERLDDLARQKVEMFTVMDRGLRSKTVSEWATIMGDEDHARTILAALTEPKGRDATKAADAKHIRAAATRGARVWIRVIQTQVHDRMGEESAGASALLAGDDNDGMDFEACQGQRRE